MALLTFPGPPLTNGQLYPTSPLPGENQYKWSAASQTWRLLGEATTVVPGCYGDSANVPAFCVDAQGRITSVTNVPIPSTGGTVTEIIAGLGLTGGTITTSGTIALNTTYLNNNYLSLTGGVMTGDITFASTQLIDCGSF